MQQGYIAPQRTADSAIPPFVMGPAAHQIPEMLSCHTQTNIKAHAATFYIMPPQALVLWSQAPLSGPSLTK